MRNTTTDRRRRRLSRLEVENVVMAGPVQQMHEWRRPFGQVMFSHFVADAAIHVDYFHARFQHRACGNDVYMVTLLVHWLNFLMTKVSHL